MVCGGGSQDEGMTRNVVRSRAVEEMEEGEELYESLEMEVDRMELGGRR